MIKDKKFFITGGAGFIGSTLIGRLAEYNRIVIYDNLRRDSLKDKPYKDHSNLTLIQGDVLDFEHLRQAMKGTNIVVHCAAIAGIDTVIKNPVKTMEVNMVGTYHVLKALQELDLISRIERFIKFFTSHIFGINTFRVDEQASTNLQPVGEARWTYSVSKLAGEHSYSYGL